MRVLEARVDRLEAVMVRLAEAEVRADERLAALTQRIDELATAQARTDAQLTALTARVDQLTERVDQLVERMDQLAVRMDQLTERVDRLAERMDQLVAAVVALTGRVDRLDGQVGNLRGMVLEDRYRDRAPAYFSNMLRRIHALSTEELAALLDEAEEREVITPAERDDLLRVDVVVRGRRRDTGDPAYLAVEVSAVVDEHDVQRALRRAEELGRATGVFTIPVVAGDDVTADAQKLSQSRGAWQVLDGRAVAPPRSPV